MLAGFENETATFLEETEDSGSNDPFDDSDDSYSDPWQPYLEDVRVRAEQQDADYVRDTYGEWPMEVYRLFVDPLDIGQVVEETETDEDGNEVVVDRSYELQVEADDRVELSGVTGRFSTQPPNLQRLDSHVPEHVQLEVTKVES